LIPGLPQLRLGKGGRGAVTSNRATVLT
jgi:hypothetical protein